MKTRGLRRLLGALVGPGAILCAVAAGCEPQDIYLFDEAEPVVEDDAGMDEPEPPPASDNTPPDDDLPEPVQPTCVSPACQRCVADGDCSAGAAELFCHPVTGDCKLPCDPEASSEQRACTAAERCDRDIGLCVDCVQDADCSSALAPVCDLARGGCVECADSSDCPAERPVCDAEAARCIECVVDADCAATGGVCLPGAQRCVGCRDDRDCAGFEDSRCLPEALLCVECLDDRDCALADPSEPFCKLSEHECDDDRE
jgi:hypothetical protein